MARIGHEFTAQDSVGNILPTTAVEVRKRSDNNLATIYDAETGGSAITQPGFQTDSDGIYSFWADVDKYYVTVGSGGSAQTYPLDLLGADGGNIKQLYEAEPDTNAYTDTEKTKLNDTNIYTTAEKAKLSGIETNADVTDTDNVTDAGAVMDTELTNEAAVKAIDQGLAAADSPTFVIVYHGDGTLALPSIAAASDTDTGFYFPAAGVLAAVVSGVEVWRGTGSGETIFGGASVPSSSVGGAAFDPNTNGRNILKLGTTVTSNQGLAEFFNPNGQVGGITVSGSTTSYNTSSDERLKTNIQDAESSGDIIDAIRVSQYDWIADDAHQRYGFIAQELEGVYPEAVSTDESEMQMKSLDNSKLVPLLLKEIQGLRIRVAALEG